MSYCVQCGVKLADYHKECPLCGTKVNNPNSEPTEVNTDYPVKEVVEIGEKRRVKRYTTGIILSMQAFAYSIIVLGIDLLTSNGIRWAYIPVLSLALLWFGVAYPLFRRSNSFFRLFTYDSIALIIYLLALNYVISHNLFWAKFAAVGILMLWVIIAGIFITDRIRKALPVTIFYIISAVVLTIIFLSFFRYNASILDVGLPIIVVFAVLGFISYFLIKASRHGAVGLVVVLLVKVTILTIAIDMIVNYYYNGAVALSWSLIIATVTIPSVVTVSAIKKSADLKSYITKKLHR